METLSSSISTLKVPSTLLSTPSREVLHHFKASHNTHKLPPQTHLHKPTTTTTKTTSFTQKPLTLSTPSFSIPTTLFSAPTLHSNPASGYAAALLDIAQCNRNLDLVHKDVKRFLLLLHNKQVEAVLGSPFVGLEEKGQVMKLVAQKGKFNKHLVSLVKMLVGKSKVGKSKVGKSKVGKSKVGIVKNVLEEFGRIYSELSGANQGLLIGM
ncbi:uncharacterized protein LOC126803265 [Argentina anserina]|uniref:uncharacterized protein LOC126803265 n=1 Tax=Argentina anserina TaxID=57926 RepID=UPI0021765F4C|nr:uncharacterized protein LOC126803265 [Potentilla anserina]